MEFFLELLAKIAHRVKKCDLPSNGKPLTEKDRVYIAALLHDMVFRDFSSYQTLTRFANAASITKAQTKN